MLEFVNNDAYLKPYREKLWQRVQKSIETEKRITGNDKGSNLVDFATGYKYFGLHFEEDAWVFREWAPNATRIFIIGDKTNWREQSRFALKRINREGVWEIHLPADQMVHGDLYRLRVHWKDGSGDRIPSYAQRVVQDPITLIFNAQVWKPDKAYAWQTHDVKRPSAPPLIYEVHIGMAQDAETIGTFQLFIKNVLPRIVDSGYNTIQLMAIQEHPYYASFGYQVSNFFSVSSRFGVPDDLKELIDRAHDAGLSVIMDIIHSHAVLNEVEGLSRFDGSHYQYFHEGGRGLHVAWNSRCFDYGKPQVLHFLLSNCKYWLDEYRFDGFRFDGVTSMLYHHHGMGKPFTSYGDYFDGSVDEEALVYLALANKLVHAFRPDAITVAEDVSGMPGLAVPISDGGVGFDYRFAMGVPDYWIRLTKDIPDEYWPTGTLWYELTNKRNDEKIISYAESHDQALVGDQTLIFRLIGDRMYYHMSRLDPDIRVDRGMALHKIIRLITLATAANGYLNFMGNEFGHPEWIDFPREGNRWSFVYAKRQWHLADNADLKYQYLNRFDQRMIEMARENRLFDDEPHLLVHGEKDKTLIFKRGMLLFAFNFHPHQSYDHYRFEVPPGKYRMILTTDAAEYGGHGRLVPDQEHFTFFIKEDTQTRNVLSLYLPARSGIVLKQVDT